jgi:signal peptidase I
VFAIVALEVALGVKTGGLGNEVKETVLAILLAVGIWYGLGFALHTSSPLDAVVSCSMLPSLDRGDMLLLQGGTVNAPVVKMSGADWEQARLDGLMGQQCAVCRDANTDYACLSDGRGGVARPSGVFDYSCGMCQRVNRDGRREYIPCTVGVNVSGHSVPVKQPGDTIVYTPQPGDTFSSSGEIVHRTRFIVDVDGKKYAFTKGDNNNWFDVQIGNSPIPEESVKGRVLARIPYLGYLKLFISGLFNEPAGCDWQFTGVQAAQVKRN